MSPQRQRSRGREGSISLVVASMAAILALFGLIMFYSLLQRLVLQQANQAAEVVVLEMIHRVYAPRPPDAEPAYMDQDDVRLLAGASGLDEEELDPDRPADVEIGDRRIRVTLNLRNRRIASVSAMAAAVPADAIDGGQVVLDRFGNVDGTMGVLPVGVALSAVPADGSTFEIPLDPGGEKGAPIGFLSVTSREVVVSSLAFLGADGGRPPPGTPTPRVEIGDSVQSMPPDASIYNGLGRLVGRNAIVPLLVDNRVAGFGWFRIDAVDEKTGKMAFTPARSALLPLARAGSRRSEWPLAQGASASEFGLVLRPELKS